MRALLVSAPLLSMFALCPPTWADSHAVTVVNSGTETIRRIEIGTTDNRLRSQLPPGAQARITYSTGCQADVRLGYDGGRTEAFPAVDVCSDPRITTGQGTMGQGTTATTTPSSPARTVSTPTSPVAPTSVASTAPVKAPPPVVPPWTGKSITKRFGGMD